MSAAQIATLAYTSYFFDLEADAEWTENLFAVSWYFYARISTFELLSSSTLKKNSW